MIPDKENKIMIQNKSAALTVDLFGGAITDFHLKEDPVNPLTFIFSKAQMPSNNKNGAPYQGHFLCLGRWGEPSEGERKAGMPNHGQIANILWQYNSVMDKQAIDMQTDSPLEGLKIERVVKIDTEHAVYGVDEKVTNNQVLGRLYNMVQHPTLASPFLDENTIVCCNATKGFDQFAYDYSEEGILQWPVGKDEEGSLLDLKNPDKPYNSVFSFVVDREAEFGWICAYNPRYHQVFGYVWRRTDYPWIHLWQDWKEGRIQYRGIEFGTTGIHQPFKKIIETGVQLFGEKTVEYIDAGETVSRRYLSFLYETKEEDIKDEFHITLEDDGGKIILNHASNQIYLDTSFKNFL